MTALQAPTPAKLFPSATEALASGDPRKLFQMRFKGIEGTVYVIAATEHQAKTAMLDNVVTIEKISAVQRSRMVVAAFAELVAAKKDPQLTLPGVVPEDTEPEQKEDEHDTSDVRDPDATDQVS